MDPDRAGARDRPTTRVENNVTTIASNLVELSIAHAGTGVVHHHGEGALIAALLVLAVAALLFARRGA